MFGQYSIQCADTDPDYHIIITNNTFPHALTIFLFCFKSKVQCLHHNFVLGKVHHKTLKRNIETHTNDAVPLVQLGILGRLSS